MLVGMSTRLMNYSQAKKNKHESRERTLATLPLLGGSLAVILTRAHHTGARGGGSDAHESVIN